MPKETPNHDYKERLRRAVDQGFVIEGGWQDIKRLTLADAPDIQLREMRKAFFAGAAHMYASIINMLEEGSEPTEDDLRRIEMIHVELQAWQDLLKREAKGMVDPI